ncbi:MAG: GNAT family N-acetyltransferase, partial [Verrucomicrobia bacterium]|nr:GNAT family N-acetyltransferase [Verrucomicrobiota bacterium]
MPAMEECAARLQPVNPLDFPNWDALIQAHPGFSIFHSAAWAKVLSATYGFVPAYLLSRGGGSAPALLPLMETQSWLRGLRGISLPFTDDCPPLYSSPAAGRELVENAFALGRERRWKFVEIRGGHELIPGAPASLSFYGHRISLEGGEASLFDRLDGSVRRAIRKAEKSGVTVSVSEGLEAVKTFYQLQCKTRKKHGLPPQPFRFFKNIWEHLLSNHMGVVVVAGFNGRPVAASVYFKAGRQSVYKYGASDEAFQHWRGANLVMWTAMKHLAAAGATTLNLGRTSLANEGLRRFKLGWGAREFVINYMKYDLNRR